MLLNSIDASVLQISYKAYFSLNCVPLADKLRTEAGGCIGVGVGLAHVAMNEVSFPSIPADPDSEHCDTVLANAVHLANGVSREHLLSLFGNIVPFTKVKTGKSVRKDELKACLLCVHVLVQLI